MATALGSRADAPVRRGSARYPALLVPVGVVTGMVGAPYLMYLLARVLKTGAS